MSKNVGSFPPFDSHAKTLGGACGDDALVVGAVRFSDAALAKCLLEHGAAAAWRMALAQGPASAAAQTKGEFAIALREPSGRAFLAVDRFATRTLCYRVVDGRLLAGVRAEELASTRDASNIDPQALFDYLYFHVIPSPRTIFKDVFRLPAGHYALFENGKLTVAPYWVPEFKIQPDLSFETAKGELRQLLRDAVASELDGSKPACFLSGGTDSSTIAGMIGVASGQPAATYSIGFEAEGYDEMEYARLAARHFKTEHHEYYVTPDDLVARIPAVARHFDQPFGNSSALPTYFCAKRARDDGVTRLLAGDGGDELFGGNTRYATQKVFGWYEHIPGVLREGLLEPIANSGLLDPIPLLKKGASYVRQARVPMPDRMHTYNLLDRIGQNTVLTAAFLAQVDAQGPKQQQRAVWQASEGAGTIDRMLAYDWRYTLAENDLVKVRGGTELAGVSVGYPLLDQALVDFSARLPASFKLKGQQLRWFFKEALRGFLPDEILTKKKHGFGLPFGVWAMRHAALKALARDSVRGLGERGIVRRDFTDRLVDELLPQHPGYYGEMVWILMMLEQWFRHYAPDYRLAD